jgi:hypothetical protein
MAIPSRKFFFELIGVVKKEVPVVGEACPVAYHRRIVFSRMSISVMSHALFIAFRIPCSTLLSDFLYFIEITG